MLLERGELAMVRAVVTNAHLAGARRAGGGRSGGDRQSWEDPE
jgi:hypothetical protein